jgi:hypothetical protein
VFEEKPAVTKTTARKVQLWLVSKGCGRDDPVAMPAAPVMCRAVQQPIGQLSPDAPALTARAAGSGDCGSA